MQIIKTKNKKTAILALLDLKAKSSLFEAPIYLANFRILKTRNNRNALKATKPWEPIKINERYIGIVDKKSITP